MSFELRIIFRGLCAFVPSTNKIGNDLSSMSILLVNAKTPTPGPGIFAHFPNLRNGTTNIPLDGDELEFLVNGNPIATGPLKIHTGGPSGGLDNFSHMPAMSEVYAGAGLSVQDNTVDYTATPPNSLVSRIKLTNGRIGSSQLIDRRLYVTEFDVPASEGPALPSSTRKNKEIGGSVLFTTPINATSVQVRSKWKNTILGSFAPSQGSVTLIIENIPKREDLAGLPLLQPGEFDLDYGLVYQIAKSPNPLRYPKVVSILPGAGPSPDPRPIMCGAAFFNAHADA